MRLVPVAAQVSPRISSTRTFFLAASRPALRLIGRRDQHFQELALDNVAAVAASSGRLKAMMPPKADVGSVAKARS